MNTTSPSLPLATLKGIPLSPHPTLSQPPYPHLFFTANVFLQLLVFSLPPFPHRSAIFAPLIFVTAFLSHLGPIGTEPRSIYAFATNWPTYIFTLSQLLFFPSPPEYRLWRNGEKPGEASTWPFGFRKFRWSLGLFLSPRGVGWNWRVKSTPEYPQKYRGESKLNFILRRLAWAIPLLFIHDFAVALVVRRYHLADGVYASTTFGGYGIKGLLRKAAIAYVHFAPIEATHIFASVVAVALGISKPEDWPPIFGKFQDLTSVQNFWGKVWHQLLRQHLTAVSSYVLFMFNLSPASLFSHFLHLFIAFFISGVGHAIPLLVLPNCRYVLPTAVIKFYLAQAVIICLENIVVDIYRKATGDFGKAGWRRLVGHLWVGFWFAMVGPWFWDDMLISGMYDSNELNLGIASLWLGPGEGWEKVK